MSWHVMADEIDECSDDSDETDENEESSEEPEDFLIFFSKQGRTRLSDSSDLFFFLVFIGSVVEAGGETETR